METVNRKTVKPQRQEGRTVKTTVELPEAVWRAAKIRAMDDRTDLRSVIIRALESYLKGAKKESGR